MSVDLFLSILSFKLEMWVVIQRSGTRLPVIQPVAPASGWSPEWFSLHFPNGLTEQSKPSTLPVLIAKVDNPATMFLLYTVCFFLSWVEPVLILIIVQAPNPHHHPGSLEGGPTM